MKDTTRANFVTLIGNQLEHVAKTYARYEKELGTVGAKRKLEMGIEASNAIMALYKDYGEPMPFEQGFIYACWPLACFWLDMIADDRDVEKIGEGKWEIH